LKPLIWIKGKHFSVNILHPDLTAYLAVDMVIQSFRYLALCIITFLW